MSAAILDALGTAAQAVDQPEVAQPDVAQSEVAQPEAAQPEAAQSAADPLRVAVIIGSTRDGRFGPTVADWFVASGERDRDLDRDLDFVANSADPADPAESAGPADNLDFDLIDLAEADLPLTMPAFGAPRPEAVAALAPRLDGADAFVIVTPEYNHSFPAALKNAIDWYNGEWRHKPVAFVSYGGISGGLRAVQQLRHVFIELAAVPIRDTVSFHEYWNEFGADRSWPRPSEARDKAVRTLLSELAWTARTMRAGRRASVGGDM